MAKKVVVSVQLTRMYVDTMLRMWFVEYMQNALGYVKVKLYFM